MKTTKLFSVFATALFVLLQTSCNKEDTTQEVIPEGYVKAVFTASKESDDEARSTLDGKTINWEAKDYLAAYCFADGDTVDIAGARFDKEGTEITSTANFSGLVPADATVAYVTYPYYIDTKTKDSESPLTGNQGTYFAINTSLPSAQTLVANSIDGACNIAACKATMEDRDSGKILTGEMKNMVAYIKFTLDGTKNITQVLVETRNSAKISGSLQIKFRANGSFFTDCYESHYVMGYAGSGNSGNTVIPAGTYYLCAAPADLTTDGMEGLKVTVSASDGKVYEHITDGVNMQRNKIYNLGTLEEQCVENTNLLSVAFDMTSLGTSYSADLEDYSFSSYTGKYCKFFYSSSNQYVEGRTVGFLTTPVISGKHLSKVNLVTRAHTNYKSPVFALMNDTGSTDVGTQYATGEYRPVNNEKPESANGVLKLFRQVVHIPNYFHQFVVGQRGDYERSRTITADTEPYQLVNVGGNNVTKGFIDRLEFIYENE